MSQNQLLSALQLTRTRRATKSIFLVCGLGMSSWAPMVPFAKDRLALNDAGLGLLLLMLGAGAIVMMPVSGIFSHRYGSRKVIIVSAIVMALVLPLLITLDSVWWMGAALFIFGAGVGTVDVAMNAHAVQVQNLHQRPIMSSLHGLFSVGGLVGSLGLGFLIKFGLDPVVAAISIAALLVAIVVYNYKQLLDHKTEMAVVGDRHVQVDPVNDKSAGAPRTNPGASRFPWLHPGVIFFGAMCFAVFLSEGAMLDWSAVFLRENRGVEEAFTGVGYAAFSVAMATMRLLGDGIVTRFSGRIVVIAGALIAAAGLFLAVSTPWLVTVLAGFILLGIGAANIVPVFFSEGGRIKNIPPTIAIPAITTMGYAGQLAGPALLGLIAFHFSLPVALAFTGLLLVLVAIAYAMRKTTANV